MTPRSRDIPPMTEAQAEALDAVHFCALKHSLKVDMRSGDMCFVNNLAIMHSRSAFEDDEPHTRYVLRVWLNNPDLGWQMPPRLQLFWDRTFAPLDEVMDYYDIDPFADKEKAKDMVSIFTAQSSQCG